MEVEPAHPTKPADGGRERGDAAQAGLQRVRRAGSGPVTIYNSQLTAASTCPAPAPGSSSQCPPTLSSLPFPSVSFFGPLWSLLSYLHLSSFLSYLHLSSFLSYLHLSSFLFISSSLLFPLHLSSPIFISSLSSSSLVVSNSSPLFSSLHLAPFIIY